MKVREHFEVHLIKAVIIGVSKYERLSDMPNLEQVLEEIDAIYNGCISLGVPEDSIHVLKEPKKKTNVENLLNKVANEASKAYVEKGR